MIASFYRFSETLISSYRQVVSFLNTEVVGDYTILEILLGTGVITFVTLVVAKWVIDFVN